MELQLPRLLNQDAIEEFLREENARSVVMAGEEAVKDVFEAKQRAIDRSSKGSMNHSYAHIPSDEEQQ